MSAFPAFDEVLKRVEILELEVKRLKQKLHDADIEEIHHRTGMEENHLTHW